jgi:hypothetical protein
VWFLGRSGLHGFSDCLEDFCLRPGHTTRMANPKATLIKSSDALQTLVATWSFSKNGDLFSVALTQYPTGLSFRRDTAHPARIASA